MSLRLRHLGVVAAVLLVGLWAWTTRQPSTRALQAPGELPAAATATRASGTVAQRPTTAAHAPASAGAPRYPAFLPSQAHAVLDAIAHGGPFDHRQDGGVFQNRERRLPPQPVGYYREYTVPTPGSDDRGPRRIVTGGDPPREYWYSDDHYRSFRAFRIDRGGSR